MALFFNIKKKLIVITSLLCLLFITNGYSQDGNDSVLVLTLEKAVDIALHQNYDILLAKKGVEKANYQIDEAYSNVWPLINGVAEYTRNVKSPVLFLPPHTPFNPGSQTQTISLGADNSYNAAITLNQTLFSLRVNTAISMANDYYNVYKFNEKSTEDQVVFLVKQSFYAALLAKEMIKVSTESYDVAKANYDNVQSLFNQGMSSEYDLLRAQVRLANVDPLLIQSRNDFEMAKNNLKNLLAIDLNKKIELSGEFKMESVDAELLRNSEQLLLENSPILTALKFQLNVLDKAVKLQRADYFPTLSGFANYMWQTQDNSFNFNEYLWSNTITVGLRLSIPIFDGFSRGARIDQALVDRDQLGITRDKTEEGLKVQLVQAQLKMQEASQRVQAQEQSLNQAARALEIAQSRYKNGIGTQLEILDTQISLTLTQTTYSQAIFEYLVAKAAWEQLLSSAQK